jgi:hypothetical protein
MKLKVSIWITAVTVLAALATPQRLAGQDHPDCSRAKFITFDAPGAGTGHREGTFGVSINPSGAIAGAYLDANDVYHGFARTREGAFTTFEAPGAGTGSFQGTFPLSNNPFD